MWAIVCNRPSTFGNTCSLHYDAHKQCIQSIGSHRGGADLWKVDGDGRPRSYVSAENLAYHIDVLHMSRHAICCQ